MSLHWFQGMPFRASWLSGYLVSSSRNITLAVSLTALTRVSAIEHPGRVLHRSKAVRSLNNGLNKARGGRLLAKPGESHRVRYM
jgi:hypothetical protein